MRYLLIPSCEVAKKDALEGTTTEKRLAYGLALWQNGGFDMIIVMGGIYLPPERQTTPSGVLMQRWLVEKGVPKDIILCEDRSRDTYENIAGALVLMGSDPNPQITVVTHWQHAFRFWVTFLLAHQKKIQFVPMWYGVGFKTFILEWLILLIHLFDHKGTGCIATWNRKIRTY